MEVPYQLDKHNFTGMKEYSVDRRIRVDPERFVRR